jgi:hypothetical protein
MPRYSALRLNLIVIRRRPRTRLLIVRRHSSVEFAPGAKHVEKIIIVGMLAFIAYNLFIGGYHMLTDRGRTTKAVKSLTWRIGLSIALIIGIGIGIKLGYIKPHGVVEGQIKSQQR